MQNKELKKSLRECPFCGGEAIRSAFSWGGITDEYTIECTICGIRTKVLKLDEAIKCWNTRKPMERIVEELEERIEQTFCDSLSRNGNNRDASIRNNAYHNALEIVHNGGKE